MSQPTINELIQQANEHLRAGSKQAAGNTLVEALKLDFYNKTAWLALHRVNGAHKDFTPFQKRLVARFFPEHEDEVPFCPRCLNAYTEGASECSRCGFALTPNALAVEPVQRSPVPETPPIRASSTPKRSTPAQGAFIGAPKTARIAENRNTVVETTFKRIERKKSRLPVFLALLGGLIGFSMGMEGGMGSAVLFGFLAAWAAAGYIGGAWLIIRGYGLEYLACLFIVGGAPLWVPAFGGWLIMWAAYRLPMHKQPEVIVVQQGAI